jgi:hypothetical protein
VTKTVSEIQEQFRDARLHRHRGRAKGARRHRDPDWR